MKNKATVFLFCFFYLLSSGFALDPEKEITQYVHDTWGVEEGLPQSSVNSIIQSKDGYLWLGTEEGLVRFDGVRLITYDKKKTDQIKNTFITVLYEDREGNLWIGTYGGGLTCKNPRNGEFSAYTTPDGLSADKVYAIYEDKEGNLWIGTEKGLKRVENGTLNAYNNGFPKEKVRAIYQDREGSLWVGTESGLKRLKNGKLTTYTTRHGLTADIVYVIYEDREGNLWIGTQKGLNRLDSEEGTFTRYTGKEGFYIVNAIYEDRDRNLWVGTSRGLLRMNTKAGKFASYTGKEWLPHDAVLSIYEDREGSLWIGTNEGLNRLKDGKFTVYSTREGLSSNRVWSVYEDKKKNLWIGTDGGGLVRMQGGRFKTFNTTTGEGLSSNRVWSVWEDREENLWIGTFGGGLLRMRDGKFTAYTTGNGLSSNHVLSICDDQEGYLWIGTDKGLNRMKDGKFTVYTAKTGQGLANDYIRVIYKDREENLWLGTEAGLYRLIRRKKDVKFTSYMTKHGLSNETIRAIYDDGEGYLWIGTYGGGLNRLDPGKNEFISITTEQGLFDDKVHKILEDDRGNFWMSCNKGIFQVSKNTLNQLCAGNGEKVRCVWYNEKDGMKSRECNGISQPPGWKRRDGTLWFPTMKGVVMIDPSHIRQNEVLPPVKIEEIIVDDKKYNLPLYEEDKKQISTPGTKRFEFRYIGLSFLYPGEVRYQYKLEGFDRKWRQVGKERTAQYTSLPPGNYTFRVLACNNDGNWNETGASVSFYLGPYFYQSWWFYTLCALAVVLLVYSGYRIRVRRLEAHAAELRTRVEQQTKDLRERKDELEAIERIIKDINQETGFEALLQSMLEKTMALFPRADKSSFLIYDKQKQLFRLAVCSGYDPMVTENISLTYEEGLRRYTEGSDQLEEGVYIVREFENIAGEKKFQVLPTPKSMLVMTLVIEGQEEGFLILDNMTDTRAFDQSDVQKLRLLREHAASAVSKAMAMEQLEIKVKERTAELVQANRELIAARDAAERASRAKSEFLANMSHEIRTPMNAILGFSEILETEIADEQHKKYLQAISFSGKALLDLINDILDLSRTEAGKMELQLEPVNPRSILNEIQHIFFAQVKEKALDFQVEAAADLPEALLLDSLRIRQILFNLVGNAVKFTDSGFIKLSVHKVDKGEGKNAAPPGSSGDNENVDIIFSVQDTGMGIAEDQLDSIFKAFESQRLSKNFGGTGLGLAISRRLTEMMGGEISVRSEVGKGSTFRVTLKNVGVSSTLKEEEPRITLEGDAIRLGKATILVVDDKKLNRQLLGRFLARQDVDIIEAENGRQAVEMVKKHRPDLVLMDIKMPVMDGYEATRLLKADDQLKSTPVIFITAFGVEEQYLKVKQAGGDGVITKPLSKLDLMGQLMRFLPYSSGESGQKTGAEVKKEKIKIPSAVALSPELKAKLPGLISILQNEFISRWEKISKTFMLDEIEDFSREIEELGNRYGLNLLENWGNLLFKDVRSFDMPRLTRTMEHFPGLIKEIETLVGGEGIGNNRMKKGEA